MITLLFQSILLILMLGLSFFLGYKIAWRKRGAQDLITMIGGEKPTAEQLGEYAQSEGLQMTDVINGYFKK